MNKTYALGVIKECNHAWKELITGEKERKLAKHTEEVQKLVRKLSKSNLLDLAPEEDQRTYNNQDEGDYDATLSF
jgi:murein L,D-transpeptidase YcbB/YkuD